MCPDAYVVHQLRGRTRLRVPEIQQNGDYAAGLAEQLDKLPESCRCRINTLTGSVLVEHPDLNGEGLLEELRSLDLFRLHSGMPRSEPAIDQLMDGFARVDRALSDRTSGSVDLRTLAFTILLGIMFRQMVRGQLLGPAVPLLLSALSFLHQANPGGGDAAGGQFDADGL
ncbi:MAG: hypothetical protein KDJ38_06275 [Gammaproteobacteria bacterium]|nr:hypothetical protein [Gammaproteobacteria bacterium]